MLSKKTHSIQKSESRNHTSNPSVQFKDNRNPSVSNIQKMANDSIQMKPNNTGLPNQLKSGIESLSGYSMDDVKVHYNSPKPAQLHAHAYAQGTDIHIASGQEKHLPHEAWHVVQQKQGRVQPAKQLKGKVNINDDTGLEREADVMGAKALQMKSKRPINLAHGVNSNVFQLAATINQVVGNHVVNFRNLWRRQESNEHVMYASGNPGFATNVGHIDGINLTAANVGPIHTEPLLIGRRYNAAQNPSAWPAANAAVDLANAPENAPRANFNLYTERVPCFACTPNLNNARYQPADNVAWSYPVGQPGTIGVATSHIPRANAQWPDYAFSVDQAEPWKLRGDKTPEAYEREERERDLMADQQMTDVMDKAGMLNEDGTHKID